jgi:hypothetical protein
VESDYAFVMDNLLTKKLMASHATRLRFYQGKEVSVTVKLAQAAEYNDHELYVVPKILGARYNEQDMLHELFVAWRGFPVSEAT